MMSLQEAIEEVKLVTPHNYDWTGNDVSGDLYASKIECAIATILNAVVKGELRAEEKQDPYWKTY